MLELLILAVMKYEYPLLNPPPTEAVHEVKPGETLRGIADDHEIDVERLWAANDDIEDPHLIYVGTELVIPALDVELEVVPLPAWIPVVAVVPPAPSTPSPSQGSVWDQVAECESNQTWDIDTGNSFYGGLQFNKMSWDWAVEVGGHDVPEWPHHASREQQIAVAETLLAIHPAGWGAWPSCASQLGLR